MISVAISLPGKVAGPTPLAGASGVAAAGVAAAPFASALATALALDAAVMPAADTDALANVIMSPAAALEPVPDDALRLVPPSNTGQAGAPSLPEGVTAATISEGAPVKLSAPMLWAIIDAKVAPPRPASVAKGSAATAAVLTTARSPAARARSPVDADALPDSPQAPVFAPPMPCVVEVCSIGDMVPPLSLPVAALPSSIGEAASTVVVGAAIPAASGVRPALAASGVRPEPVRSRAEPVPVNPLGDSDGRAAIAASPVVIDVMHHDMIVAVAPTPARLDEPVLDTAGRRPEPPSPSPSPPPPSPRSDRLNALAKAAEMPVALISTQSPTIVPPIIAAPKLATAEAPVEAQRVALAAMPPLAVPGMDAAMSPEPRNRVERLRPDSYQGTGIDASRPPPLAGLASAPSPVSLSAAGNRSDGPQHARGEAPIMSPIMSPMLTVASDRLGDVGIGLQGGPQDLRVQLSGSTLAAGALLADASRLVADLAASGLRLHSLDIGGDAGSTQAGGQAASQGSSQNFGQPAGDGRPRGAPPPDVAAFAADSAGQLTTRRAPLSDRYA